MTLFIFSPTTLVRVAALSSLVASISGAQTMQPVGTPVVITRTRLPVRIDGRPDDQAWQQTPAFPLRMYTPTAGGSTSDSTEVRLLYDDQFLYASGTFFTPDATTIRPGLFARDQMGAEDHFMLILDTANDNQTGYVFSVTPSGARTDYAVGGDGQSLDRNWNGFWDGTATRDEKGWYAELRIPLSTLRFQSVAGKATMGLIIHRYTSARSEYDSYPALSPTFANALFRLSIAQKIELADVEARSPLYVTPYVMGGVSSAAVLNSSHTAYGRSPTDTREIGVDAKFGLTSSLAMDLTANTDFAQVEADNQQVNLTRFSLFFPEKRQFFLERADLFAVGSGNGDLLFNSRRIGLAGNGTPLRIYGGARVVGRIGSWDVGAMSMQTETPGGHGTENDAAVRLQRSVFNAGSFVGGLFTSRFAPDGRHNVLASADAVLRPFGNDFVTLQAGQSINDGASSVSQARMARLNWERRSSAGLQYSGGIRWLGSAFDPALGFQLRNGITSASASLGYGWLPGTKTVFSSISPMIAIDGVQRHDDRVIDTRSANAMLHVNLKNGVGAVLYGGTTYERIDQAFPIASTATVPKGDYSYGSVGASVSSNNRTRLSASAGVQVGELYDGRQTSFNFGPQWNASEHLQVGSSISLLRLDFPARGQHADADLARVRVQYAYDSRISAAAFIQYNRAAESAAANIRLRWQFAEGRDLWIVYNDLLNTERDPLQPGAPERPFSTTRTFLVKYTHTLAR